MKINTKNRNLILISLGLLVGSLLIVDSTPKNYKEEIDSNVLLRTSQISGKIYINNNWTDTKNAGLCTGSGTLTDPYVIQDLVIDANNTGSCIVIQNSDAYFKIENCTLINSGTELVDSGILLINVDNAEISDNTILNNYMGVDLNNSHNSTIHNNFLDDNSLDIRFMHSNNTLAYLNDCVSPDLNLFFYNSTFLCRTPKKITYIYEGYTFTEYLGNYWDNYEGNDNDNDGIGDVAYTFYNSHVVHVDLFPLMQTTDHYSLTPGGIIPGYNVYLFVGTIFMILFIILIKKSKKTKIY